MARNIFDWLHDRVRSIATQAGVAVPRGASDAAVEDTQAYLRRTLPPSFARLLKMQNGWPDAWNGLNLLSTQAMRGEGTDGWDLLMQRERFWRDRQINPQDSKAISKYKPADGLVVPWRMLIVGLAKDGRILCFDTRKKADADGEWPLLYVLPDGTVRRSFASFNEFLQAVVNEGLGHPADD